MEEFNFEPLKFEDSFVVFLDILGFRDLVMNDDKSKLQKINVYFTLIEEIYFKALREELKNLNKSAHEIGAKEDTLFKLDYIIISDSIIITMKILKSDYNDMSEKIKNDKKMQELYSARDKHFNVLNKLGFEKLCEAIVKIQRYMACQNIWLQGAISVGTTHISTNKNQIIGRAYIDAYELEKKARYPRVILAPNILEVLDIKCEDEFIKTIPYMFSWNDTSLEKDLPLFLDYVGFLIYVPTDENIKILNKIVVSLIEDFHKTKGLDWHYKYVWTLEYMQECLKRGGDDYINLYNKLNEIKKK